MTNVVCHNTTFKSHKGLAQLSCPPQQKCGKFIPWWNGLYNTVECFGQNNYRLTTIYGNISGQKANGKDLKQWKENMTPSCEKPRSNNSTTDHAVAGSEEQSTVSHDSYSRTTLEYLSVCKQWPQNIRTCLWPCYSSIGTQHRPDNSGSFIRWDNRRRQPLFFPSNCSYCDGIAGWPLSNYRHHHKAH